MYFSDELMLSKLLRLENCKKRFKKFILALYRFQSRLIGPGEDSRIRAAGTTRLCKYRYYISTDFRYGVGTHDASSEYRGM